MSAFEARLNPQLIERRERMRGVLPFGRDSGPTSRPLLHMRLTTLHGRDSRGQTRISVYGTMSSRSDPNIARPI